ncbi:MAG: hypothetical protein HC896_14815 [Bacteroidales bacterium]|nr:hypothetical protein [Bacteroidales bacterium]
MHFLLTKKPILEIEPIGPQITLGPGDTTGFNEDWWLMEPDSETMNAGANKIFDYAKQFMGNGM